MKLTRFNNCKLGEDAKDEHYKVEPIEENLKSFNLPNDYRKPVVFVLGVKEAEYDE